MKAPGTENITTFLPLNSSAVSTSSMPFSPRRFSFTDGIESPILMVMGRRLLDSDGRPRDRPAAFGCGAGREAARSLAALARPRHGLQHRIRGQELGQRDALGRAGAVDRVERDAVAPETLQIGGDRRVRPGSSRPASAARRRPGAPRPRPRCSTRALLAWQVMHQSAVTSTSTTSPAATRRSISARSKAVQAIVAGAGRGVRRRVEPSGQDEGAQGQHHGRRRRWRASGPPSSRRRPHRNAAHRHHQRADQPGRDRRGLDREAR